MDYIRVISYNAQDEICQICEVPGDRDSWRYWWPTIRSGDYATSPPVRHIIERA